MTSERQETEHSDAGDEEQRAAYAFVPSDPELALALSSAERMAREADEKFCVAFGGDGETSAYWLTAAIGEVRAAMYRIAQSRADAGLFMSDANQILRRVFDNDDIMEQFVAWYNPSDWLHGYRALGAFIRATIAAHPPRAVPDETREAVVGDREDKIQRAIDRCAHAAVTGFRRESHMTLREHIVLWMRMLVCEVSTLAATPRAVPDETREAVAFTASAGTCRRCGSRVRMGGPAPESCTNCAAPAEAHPPRAGEVTEEMVQRGVAASQHITDQYGSTTFVPRDVVQSILTAALERSS